MSLSTLLFVLLATSVANCEAAYLRIIEAGVPDGSWTPGPKLSGVLALCPKNLFDQFTVECVPDATGTSTPAWGMFHLNGAFYRREFVGPFVLTGQFLLQPIPWERYPSTSFIECILSNGEETSTTIQFSCSAGAIAVAPVAPLPATTPLVAPLPTTGGAVNVDIGVGDDHAERH